MDEQEVVKQIRELQEQRTLLKKTRYRFSM